MNCEECKNIINELHDLSEARNDTALAAHLAACKECQRAYKFAEKVRQGFALIAEESPPPFLARKIFDIQGENAELPAEQWSLSRWLRQCFMSFSFKMAVTLWLVTLLSGGLLLRYIDYGGAKMQQGVEIAEKPELEHPLEQLVEKPLTQPISQPLAQPFAGPEKKEMQVAMRVEPAPVSAEPGVASSWIAETIQSEKDSCENSEKIPGAMSFSLENEAVVAKRNNVMFDKADFDAGVQVAETFDDVQDMKSAKSAAPTAPVAAFEMARLARAPEMSKARAKIYATEEAGSSIEKTDPRTAEILELLIKHHIELAEGFVDLEELAMKGYVGSEELRALQPPAGCSWFLIVEEDQKKIVARKR